MQQASQVFFGVHLNIQVSNRCWVAGNSVRAVGRSGMPSMLPLSWNCSLILVKALDTSSAFKTSDEF